MDFIFSFYVACLFFILSPNVLLRIPSGGSVIVVAAVHACVFALIYQVTHKFVWRLSVGCQMKKGLVEGFREGFAYVCGPPARPCPDDKFCINKRCKNDPDF